jgi:hypothetical protein
MSKRPLLFIILGILHILEPLIKILYFKATTHFSFSTIFSNISAERSMLGLFEFWLLFPIGGIALLGVKKWSYPLFVGVQIYSLWNHLTYQKYNWPYYSEVPHWPSMVLLGMNFFIVCYFTLPEVRRPFFESSLRWWEHRKRYNITLPISFHFGDPEKLHYANLLNISETGVFISYRHPLIDKGNPLWMNISYGDTHIKLKGKVVGLYQFESTEGIGVKFKFENIFEKLLIKKVVKKISKTCKQQENTIKVAA